MAMMGAKTRTEYLIRLVEIKSKDENLGGVEEMSLRISSMVTMWNMPKLTGGDSGR